MGAGDGLRGFRNGAEHTGRFIWAFYASQALQQKEDMFFTVNWRNDISAADCFIGYKGIIYDITRIDTFEGYKDDLKLYALMLATQPKSGEILPYG